MLPLPLNIDSTHDNAVSSEDVNSQTDTHTEIIWPSPEYMNLHYNSSESNQPNENVDHSDYYEVETHPINPNNKEQFSPITNYFHDEIIESNVHDGWEKIEPDIIPDHCQFTDSEGINMSTNS